MVTGVKAGARYPFPSSYCFGAGLRGPALVLYRRTANSIPH